MPDVDLTCIECKDHFPFSEKDQDDFYRNNMMTPQRCTKCRSRKRVIAADATPKFEIVCDNCGKHDRVPFQPKEGRTVLCRNCHNAKQAKRQSY